MKRTFLFISGLHRDMVGVTTVYATPGMTTYFFLKRSLTSLPPLYGKFICCGAKTIWLPLMVFLWSSVSSLAHLPGGPTLIMPYSVFYYSLLLQQPGWRAHFIAHTQRSVWSWMWSESTCSTVVSSDSVMLADITLRTVKHIKQQEIQVCFGQNVHQH